MTMGWYIGIGIGPIGVGKRIGGRRRHQPSNEPLTEAEYYGISTALGVAGGFVASVFVAVALADASGGEIAFTVLASPVAWVLCAAEIGWWGANIGAVCFVIGLLAQAG
jgi:hypothetical protein